MSDELINQVTEIASGLSDDMRKMSDAEQVRYVSAFGFFSNHGHLFTTVAGEPVSQAARRLAQAEHWIEEEGVSINWLQDDNFEEPDSGVVAWEMSMRDVNHRLLADVGGIIDPMPELKRVIEAEVALSVMRTRANPYPAGRWT